MSPFVPFRNNQGRVKIKQIKYWNRTMAEISTMVVRCLPMAATQLPIKTVKMPRLTPLERFCSGVCAFKILIASHKVRIVTQIHGFNP